MDNNEQYNNIMNLLNEFQSNSYSLSKKQIIQDNLNGNSSKKTIALNFLKNNNTIKNRILIFKNFKLNFITLYSKFMENINLRNNFSKIFGILVNILAFGSICYCIFIPLNKINYYILSCLLISGFIFDFLYKRLWIEIKDVCPKCFENGGLIDKGIINTELISKQLVQNPYEIFNLKCYKYTNRKVCKYCNYFEDSQWEDEEEEFVAYTQLGLIRLENERHEKAMREENMRHEEADLRNRKEANDDFIQKQEEAWEKRRRGY